MRNLRIAFVVAGMSSVMVGCGEGNTPSPPVNITEKSAPETNVTPDIPPDMDLVEPTVVVEPAPVVEPAVVVEPAPFEPAVVVEPAPVDEPSPVAELTIGDDAPPISIAKWVNADAVEGFTGEKVYVVEFWATWCGPCLAGMPHIAALQTEYGDKVRFIGVTAEEEEVVSEFMGQSSRDGKLWSEVLTYSIALDQNGQTNKAYMQAAGQNGIPCAFIVGKSRKVEWIGHPASIDKPLQEVVDGTWDLAKARATFLAAHEVEELMQEVGPKINAALQNGDFKAALVFLDQLIEKSPEDAQLKQARFQFLLKGEMFDEANKAAEIMVQESNDNALELNQLAWVLATAVSGPGPDLDIALASAKRAEELTESKDASILDTLSRVHFRKGNIEEAIANQKKAIEIADPQMKEQLEAALQEYEAALKPAEGEAKPAEGEAKPAEGEAKPAEGEAEPAEGDAN